MKLSIESETIDGYFITFSELYATGWHRIQNVLNSSKIYNSEGKPNFYPSPQVGEEVYGIFLDIFNEWDKKEKSMEEVIRVKLLELLFKAERHYLLSQPQDDTPGNSGGEIYLQRFRELVETNFSKGWSVVDYASALAVHPNHLNKLCKSLYGKSASQVIQDRLLVEAKILLTYTSHSISEISFQLGFNEPSYFFKFFKKQQGTTAQTFRKQARS